MATRGKDVQTSVTPRCGPPMSKMTHSLGPSSGIVRRHHLVGQTFQLALKRTVMASGMTKPAVPHTLRREFAMHSSSCRRASDATYRTRGSPASPSKPTSSALCGPTRSRP